MKTKFLQHIGAYLEQRAKEDTIFNAFHAMNRDNGVVSIQTEAFTRSHEDLLMELFSDPWMDYVWWWIYDCPKDSKWVDVTGGDGKMDRIWVSDLEQLYDFLENHVKTKNV